VLHLVQFVVLHVVQFVVLHLMQFVVLHLMQFVVLHVVQFVVLHLMQFVVLHVVQFVVLHSVQFVGYCIAFYSFSKRVQYPHLEKCILQPAGPNVRAVCLSVCLYVHTYIQQSLTTQ